MNLVIIFFACVGLSMADTPANCLYEDIRGTWKLHETERNGNHSISCDELGEIVHENTFTLEFPDVVKDELGNQGTWTMIYNQGFEVNINQRSYFAFSYYEGDWGSSTSYCNRTFNGWSRDVTIRNWSCFKAEKLAQVPPTFTERPVLTNGGQMYKNDENLIKKINIAQTSWTAKAYPEHENYTVEEMYLRTGGLASVMTKLLSAAPVSPELQATVASLPDSFDWRNINGVNYISPVGDQASCGSCYAFASVANLEAKLRIASKNQRQDIFSTQDMVSCTYLDQGCSGGFDYLVAGRYAMEQGVVSESENRYLGRDAPCTTSQAATRTYVKDYRHVGGYYGACNEAAMIEAIVNRGPVSVSFQVYSDFPSYSDGIYHHTGFVNEFNPFEETNHVVLVVGYGVEESTGEKYWIVKNSWGDWWGEKGYFRIRRGTDECAIESMAVEIDIIP
ncbi:dipeptidyl peptidase 1-like isoform X2 [Macrobrachium nipponense]|uniref:dipeptidyl peptidase 1-like isoform X2 n=1 Tax=Macrobrachium nipponense TaxID=159736 RepID=UPI0030C7B4BD